MVQTSVTSGRRGAKNWKLLKREFPTWEGFWRRLKEKMWECHVDHISEVFYAVRGASSFFTACLDRLTVISRSALQAKVLDFFDTS